MTKGLTRGVVSTQLYPSRFYSAYNLFGPESHLSMVETTVIIIATGAIYKAMSAVKFTSNLALKLFVSFELCSILIAWSWRNVIFASPLFVFAAAVVRLALRQW